MELVSLSNGNGNGNGKGNTQRAQRKAAKIAKKSGTTGTQRAAAVDWLLERLGDASPLTRTFALQALVDFSDGDAGLRARVMPMVREFAESGTAAMRARGRKLLKRKET